MKHLLPLFFLLSLTIRCSVTPALESPRIISGVRLETNVTSLQNELKLHYNDSMTLSSYYLYYSNIHFGSQAELSPKLQVGFSNRVELGGYFWWVLLNHGWDGKVKVKILDTGEQQLFHNIAVALLAGSKGFNGEWDESSRHWAGITAGTIHTLGNLDIEFILMPTVGKNRFQSRPAGIGSAEVSFFDVDVNTGISLFLTKRVYSSFALLLSVYDFYYHYNMYQYISRIDRIEFIPQKVGFNATLGFIFGKSKR